MLRVVKNQYKNLSQKLLTGIAFIALPILSFADDPSPSGGNAPSNPFGSLGSSITSDSKGIVHGTGVYLESVFDWVGIGVGALVLIGAIIFIWNTVNMPKEEKEHHNIPLRIMMALAGVVICIALIAFLISSMGSNA